MNQQNPLLYYRIHENSKLQSLSDSIHFNLKSGLWENENGNPIIEMFLEKKQTRISSDKEKKEISTFLANQTRITATREGIDQSEISNLYLNSTIVTLTREASDQSERVI